MVKVAAERFEARVRLRSPISQTPCFSLPVSIANCDLELFVLEVIDVVLSAKLAEFVCHEFIATQFS